MSNIVADYIPDTRTIVAHLRDHLGVGIRWNGLFLCFEIAFSCGNDEGQWLPASPDWRGDPIHCRLRHMLGKTNCRRSLGTYQGYDAMLQLLRASRETQCHPLDHLPFAYGMEPVAGSDSLVAHTAALHKAYRPMPRHLPLLAIPHEYPLMPAKWAHLRDYVFNLQPLSETCSYRLGNLWRRSGEARPADRGDGGDADDRAGAQRNPEHCPAAGPRDGVAGSRRGVGPCSSVGSWGEVESGDAEAFEAEPSPYALFSGMTRRAA